MEKMEIRTEDDLPNVARNVLEYLQGKTSVGAQVLALHGELGAGKTTFVKALAEALGVEEVVTSPTFVILKLYPLDESGEYQTLAHIDAYRVDDQDEMRPLRFESLLKEEGVLICIEWAERIKDLLPEDTLHMTFTINKDGSRTITYT